MKPALHGGEALRPLLADDPLVPSLSHSPPPHQYDLIMSVLLNSQVLIPFSPDHDYMLTPPLPLGQAMSWGLPTVGRKGSESRLIRSEKAKAFPFLCPLPAVLGHLLKCSKISPFPSPPAIQIPMAFESLVLQIKLASPLVREEFGWS